MEKIMPFQEGFHYRMALKGLVAGFHTGYFDTNTITLPHSRWAEMNMILC